MPEIVPVLEEGLNSEDSNIRQGVCVGLSEIMAVAGKSQISHFSGTIIPSIRRAICDPNPDVREPAAEGLFPPLPLSLHPFSQIECLDPYPSFHCSSQAYRKISCGPNHPSSFEGIGFKRFYPVISRIGGIKDDHCLKEWGYLPCSYGLFAQPYDSLKGKRYFYCFALF